MNPDLFADGSAVISECGRYRYRLDRRVADAGPVYAFFGVNPSTADASIDDATVRKWRGFVTRWGGSRFIVGNVFAFRATNVKELAEAADAIGRLNNDYLAQIIAEADVLVPCWGNRSKAPPMLRSSFHWLMQVLHAFGQAGEGLRPIEQRRSAAPPDARLRYAAATRPPHQGHSQ